MKFKRRNLPKTSCFSLFFSKTSQESHDHHYLPTIPSMLSSFLMCSSVLTIFDDFLMIFSSYHFPIFSRKCSEVRPRSVRGPSAHQGPERRQRGFGGDRTGAIGPRGEDHRHGRARLLRVCSTYSSHVPT